MKAVFFHTLRGVELEIVADDFDGDESVGIAYGPETLTATRLDNGQPFELTDSELESLGIKASEIFYGFGWSDRD